MRKDRLPINLYHAITLLQSHLGRRGSLFNVAYCCNIAVRVFDAETSPVIDLDIRTDGSIQFREPDTI
ncbi:hypothetical protein BX591_119134 [Paraburkholderia bryophila]|uniref:Uncharacterized protein n=1 Tax=Paraburkholderia bryophila TaxID=420952 RepID=A0A329BPN9_9BURK|nr:hypothetical protein BX591_119134 [Paraburkholderia bryophila]